MLEHLDGSTTGPRAFSGPIGKALSICQHMNVVAFDKIEAVLPTVDLISLSTDQKYLWEITEAVSRGECSHALAQRQPGTLNHSRLLTTANLVLRLYVAISEPSEQLKPLATYIVRVYAPMCSVSKQNLRSRMQLSTCGPQFICRVICRRN